MYLVTADEMQRMDRATIDSFGIPGRVLMENAGRGATAFLSGSSSTAHHPGSRRALPPGAATTAGTALSWPGIFTRTASERHGVPARSKETGSKGDAAANLNLLDAMGVPVVEMADDGGLRSPAKPLMRRQHTWIDAILGTGLPIGRPGILPGEPSNSSTDRTGRSLPWTSPPASTPTPGGVCGAGIHAAATATFGFAKVGHLCLSGTNTSPVT
jgi:NAD(P)H-hydrate repair Nnr-like enzyme with NAD(P)H-hydrate epimerase domain